MARATRRAAAVAARDGSRPWLTDDGALNPDPDSIAALLAAFPEAPPEVARTRCACSRHFGPWLARASGERSRKEARAAFEADVAAGRAEIDVLKFPLLPYQRLGALHLAFGERALLADDMGLGKTIQAIAACELLARRKGVERVLVVCPASLKTEWEEQIARFNGRSIGLVFGPRGERLAAYRAPGLLHDRQLRAGADRRRRHQRAPEARHRRARRGAADQELADQDRAQGQERCARRTPSC